MRDSLSNDNTPYLVGSLYLESKLGLEQVGQLISKHLAGGAPFIGREEHIRDEVPAIYVPNFLAGKLILLGDNNEYELAYEFSTFQTQAFQNLDLKPVDVDISGLFALALKDAKDVKVFI